MDVRIFIVLLLFMGLFLGGGVLLIKGGLAGNRKQVYMGVAMLALCILLMIVAKNMKGLY